MNLGDLEIKREMYSEAETHLKEAISVAEEIKNYFVLHGSWNFLGETYCAQEKYLEAKDAFTSTITIGEGVSDPEPDTKMEIGNAYFGRAKAHCKLGEKEEPKADKAKALEIFNDPETKDEDKVEEIEAWSCNGKS